MKVLFALTYYRPYVSGVTIYVQRLSEAFVARGHKATVLTSQYSPKLPSEEILNGVRIVRVPISFRISKGVMMPSYWKYGMSLVKEHDIVAVNLPSTPFEAVMLPFIAKFIVRRPVTATYHCDLNLPSGIFNNLINKGVFYNNCAAGFLANRIVAYTNDYANHSPFLRAFPGKRTVIPPPVIIDSPADDEVRDFKNRYAPGGERLIGFAARFATEKGVEYMLHALPLIRKEIGNVKVLFVGEYENVIGEKKYWELLQPVIKEAGSSWAFLGVLNSKELSSFYKACDVTVLPSINSTESFGMVQVESMLCGTPVVSTDMPGVRVPIKVTKMGITVPACNSQALSDAVVKIINNRSSYIRPREEIEKCFSLETTVSSYEGLFHRLINFW